MYLNKNSGAKTKCFFRGNKIPVNVYDVPACREFTCSLCVRQMRFQHTCKAFATCYVTFNCLSKEPLKSEIVCDADGADNEREGCF